MKRFLPVLLLGLTLGACSSDNKADQTATAPSAPPAAAPTTPPADAPSAAKAAPDSATAPAAAAGFDPATAPVSTASLPGAFPYFSPLKGYEALSTKNRPGDSAREFQKDVEFDGYTFFDGVKLIPVEGRRYTMKMIGKGASFLQAKRNYEALIKQLGGVTVFEGKGQVLKDHNVKFEEGTHRGRYWLEKDDMGVYFLRTPDKEIWVEVYNPYPGDTEDYWLTVVERKALNVTARLLQAEEMKQALDANGRVALYINFDTDKATIKPESLPTVLEMVKLLSGNPGLKLNVEGHTDNAGTPAHNQELSEARAKAVVTALTGLGIGADRLQPQGFGQSKPLADNATEDGRAKNRRVELVKR